MEWILLSDKMPPKDEPILCLSHFSLEQASILRRIEPRPVPFELLHEKMCEDTSEDFYYNKQHGWVPGCCFEFVKQDINGTWDGFTNLELDANFYLAKEIIYWMPIPPSPEDSDQYFLRTYNK